MPRAPTGTVEYRQATGTAPSGWWARVTCADKSRPWLPLTRGSEWPNTPQGRERAKEAARGLSERIREKGLGAVQPSGPAAGVASVKSKPSEADTVDGFAKLWLDDRDRRGLRSRKTDEGRYRIHIAPTIGTKAIRDVQPDDLRAVVESLDTAVREDRMAWLTAVKCWALVTKMFADSCQSKTTTLRIRHDDPTRSVKGPDRGETKSKQWLYPVEVSKLLACQGDEVPQEWQRLYALAIYLYLRPGELAALTWDDVNFEQAYVNVCKALDFKSGTIKTTKTKTTRKVPIQPSLVPLLRHLHEESGGKGRVIEFPQLDGLADTLRGHLTAAGVTRSDLHDDGKTAKRITFDDLRATGITWEVLAKTEHVRIMQRAGHEQFETTLGYIREADAVGLNAGEPFPLPELLLKTKPQRIVTANRHAKKRGNRFNSLTARNVRGEGGAPGMIRTCDIRFRRPTLYPAELRALGEPTGSTPGQNAK